MRKIRVDLIVCLLTCLAGCSSGTGTPGNNGSGSNSPGNSAPPSGLTVTTSTLPAGTVGVSYSGQVIATGEGYKTKASALKGVESVQKNAPGATIDDQTG